MKKRKKRGAARLFSALLGFVCALILGALFYGTMAYQLAGEEGAKERTAAVSPASLEPGKSAKELFPGQLLSLDAQLVEERARDIAYGGETCREVVRVYEVSGLRVTAVSAAPSAYLARLAAEGFAPQLVTGFSLAGLDAVYERQGETGLLAAQDGGFVYLLLAQADEQTLYALGAGAVLE